MNKRHLISNNNNNNKLHQRNYKSTPSLRRSITTKRPSTTSSTIKPFKSNRKISSRKTRDDSIITTTTNNNNNNKRKSGLPPTFRSYTQNLKADLIYAKFHVRNVKGARERRHIDQARRARMFQIQLLRERNRKEKEEKKKEEKELRQAKLIEEANNNEIIHNGEGTNNTHPADGEEDKTSNISSSSDDGSAIFHVFDDEPEEDEDDVEEQHEIVISKSSPTLNINLIRPVHNHVYSISPTHKTKSRLYKEDDGKAKNNNNSMNQDDDYDNTSSLQQLLKFQNTKRINKNNDDTLTFKRRGRKKHVDDMEDDDDTDLSLLIIHNKLTEDNNTKTKKPTKNKSLLSLQNYKDEFTTLNYKTSIDFNRMSKRLRYPDMFINDKLKAEKASKRSLNAYLQTYRKKWKKQIRANKFNISKNELNTILKDKKKQSNNNNNNNNNSNESNNNLDEPEGTEVVDDDEKNDTVDHNKLYYERKKLRVLSSHDEKLQLKHIDKLRVEQKERIKRNEMLYRQLREMQGRQRRKKVVASSNDDSILKKKKSKREKKKKRQHIRIHNTDVEDVIAYKLNEKKKHLFLQTNDDDSSSLSKEDPPIIFKDIRFANSPSISSPFQTPYFEHLKMSDLKQRELEDMMIKVNQIQKFNKKHPELKRLNLNGSLNEKEMFAQLNRANTMQVISVKNKYTNNRRRRTMNKKYQKRSSKFDKTPLYRLPIAHSKEKYQSVFDGFNEEGNVLWEDLERLYSQISPYDGNDVINGRRRRYRESPLPKAMNPFLFPGGKKTKK